MGKIKKKHITTKKFDKLAEEGVDLDQYLERSEKEWRLIVDFKPEMTAEIKQIAERLGINWQATVKMLLDEAITARKERQAALNRERAS